MGKETAFSFHCMICFEEFDNTEERYPVVLPCGHTYVCNTCGKRLDKCMECRTPVYMTFAPGTETGTGTNSATTPLASSWSRGRNGVPVRPNSPPPKPPSKKRLPLPKNVVLLSLIEATELASANVRKDHGGIKAAESSSEVESVDNEEEREQEKISLATSLSVGVTGTYAVIVKGGLDIFPTRPSNLMDVTLTDEDVDTMVQFFHSDKKVDSDGSVGTNSSQQQTHSEELARLAFGDRIQVVSVESGWARLARGYGYVQADHNQVVKVGSPVDRACKLEAMLRTLSDKRKELRIQQSKVDNQFIQLMNQLQVSLTNDEDLTVICGTAFADTSEPGSSDREDTEDEKKADSSPKTEADSSPDNNYTIKPAVAPVHEIESVRTGIMCFAPELLRGDDCDDTQIEETSSMRDVTASARQLLDAANSSLFPAASHPSPSQLRAGAQAWRERQGSAARNTGVDFRTGLSGHTALMSTHVHAHEYLEPENSRTHTPVNFRMSSHTGLTRARPHRRLGGAAPRS